MRIRITKPGIFGVLDGESTEIPVGHEFEVDKEPTGWVGRYEVISRDTSGEELESDEDSGTEESDEDSGTEESDKPRSRRRR